MELRHGIEINRTGTSTAVLTTIKTIDLSNSKGFSLFLKNTGDTNGLVYSLKLYPNKDGEIYNEYTSGTMAVGAVGKDNMLIEVESISYAKAVLQVSGVTTYLVEGYRLNNLGA